MEVQYTVSQSESGIDYIEMSICAINLSLGFHQGVYSLYCYRSIAFAIVLIIASLIMRYISIFIWSGIDLATNGQSCLCSTVCCLLAFSRPCSAARSASGLRDRGPWFDTRSRLLAFVFVLQEGQLSVTDKSMSTLVMVNHLGGLRLPRNSVIRLTYCPNMTIGV